MLIQREGEKQKTSLDAKKITLHGKEKRSGTPLQEKGEAMGRSGKKAEPQPSSSGRG